MGAGWRDCAGLAIVVVLGPCRSREERLVVHEVGFTIEQIVHAAVVSLEERPRVIHEGQIDALGFFPPAFIVQGHPIVLRGVQEGIRLVVVIGERDVLVPNDFVIEIEPLEHGALYGQVVHDMRVSVQAGGLGVGVGHVPAGDLQQVDPGLGEHDIPGLVGMDAFNGLDDLVVEERAKEFVGTLGRQAEALGKQLDRGELKFQEPVEDEPALVVPDGPGICERGITAFNAHGTTSFPGVGETGGLRTSRHEPATLSGFFVWSWCRLAIRAWARLDVGANVTVAPAHGTLRDFQRHRKGALAHFSVQGTAAEPRASLNLTAG